jgi:hypothetical protein
MCCFVILKVLGILGIRIRLFDDIYDEIKKE